MKQQITKVLMLAVLVFFIMPVHAQAPDNDLITNPTPIPCDGFKDGTTEGATLDSVGTCGTSNTAPGVWYVVLGTGGNITASTCNQAAYDTKISVFSNGGATCIGGNDDGPGCSGFTSEFTFPTNPGEPYLILVHGFGSAQGDFTISISCAAPPSGNDACNGAIPLECNSSKVGNTSNATADFAPFCGTSNTAPGVWYSYSSSEAKGITLSTCSPITNYDTKISVFEGSCGGLVCVDGNDDDFSCGNSIFQSTVVFFDADPGTTYYILVHGFGSATGDFELSISCEDPPANDGPCGAEPLTLGVAKDFNNSFASADDGEVSPGAGTGASSCNSQDGWCSFETGVDNSLWFSFEVPPSGAVSVEAPGFDSQIAVWSADDCGDYSTYTEIAANDDSGPGLAAFLELYCLTPGETLLVQVDGFGGASTTAGTVTVSDLGGLPLTVDAGGCQTKFVGYEPAEGVNNLAAEVNGGTAPYTYSWSGDGIVTNPNQFSVSVDPTDTTTYTVTVTDANGCTAEDTVEVTVENIVCDDKDKKVFVCHIPEDNPDNPQQLCISKNAVEAHLAHGDLLGSCENTCRETLPPPPVCSEVEITITADDWPNETSWEITDDNDNVISSGALSFGDDFQTFTVFDECLILSGCYTFTIFDSFGDGICCAFGQGSYTVTVDGQVVGSGGDFGSSDSVQFGDCNQVRQDETIAAAPTQKSSELGEISVLPNPFRSDAVIKYIPALDGNATIDIFTINGTLVSRIYDLPVKRGQVVNAEVLGSQLRSNGIYIYQVRIADKMYSGKLVYMK